MKRDAVAELQNARAVEGLKRKVSKLGRLAAKFQGERDRGREVTSRLLIDKTLLEDAIELVLDEFQAWRPDDEDTAALAYRYGVPEANALRKLSEAYYAVQKEGDGH